MRVLVLAAALVFGLVVHVWADYEDGVAAFNRDDYAEALREWRPLAERGDVNAQYKLGQMYAYGFGVPQDYAEAVKWFRRAAEQGDANAQLNLGAMYGEGEGVRRDYVQSHMWSNIAASQLEPGLFRELAVRNRNLVEKRMTPGQVAEAQQLARNWKPKTQAATASYSRTDRLAEIQEMQRIGRVQKSLLALGYIPGPIDGILGPKSRAAIRAFQADHDLPVTGKATYEVELALLQGRSAREGTATDVEPIEEEPSTSITLEELRKKYPLKTKPKLHSTGSGFAVSTESHILTNEHVIKGCREIRLPPTTVVEVEAVDEPSDLALLSAPGKWAKPATFGRGRGVRPGDDIVVVGFPLQGLLASDLNVTSGIVSALAGLGNDRRFIQITAPVQQGNSGSPLLDLSGNVAGVVVAKLDALLVAGLTGNIPQNVNFAVSAGTVRAFLDAYNVPYQTAPSVAKLCHIQVAPLMRSNAM